MPDRKSRDRRGMEVLSQRPRTRPLTSPSPSFTPRSLSAIPSVRTATSGVVERKKKSQCLAVLSKLSTVAIIIAAGPVLSALLCVSALYLVPAEMCPYFVWLQLKSLIVRCIFFVFFLFLGCCDDDDVGFHVLGCRVDINWLLL